MLFFFYRFNFLISFFFFAFHPFALTADDLRLFVTKVCCPFVVVLKQTKGLAWILSSGLARGKNYLQQRHFPCSHLAKGRTIRNNRGGGGIFGAQPLHELFFPHISSFVTYLLSKRITYYTTWILFAVCLFSNQSQVINVNSHLVPQLHPPILQKSKTVLPRYLETWHCYKTKECLPFWNMVY